MMPVVITMAREAGSRFDIWLPSLTSSHAASAFEDATSRRNNSGVPVRKHMFLLYCTVQAGPGEKSHHAYRRGGNSRSLVKREANPPGGPAREFTESTQRNGKPMQSEGLAMLSPAPDL
jgi:hypothetical protein